MIITERRFEVRVISSEALAGYMAFRGLSVRTLAEKAGCSHSLIGFLRKGTRSTCSPKTARAIAEALNCPVEALFAPRTSIVQREVGPSRRAA